VISADVIKKRIKLKKYKSIYEMRDGTTVKRVSNNLESSSVPTKF
jgi:hypothetical protein